jgi:hypothetical protein
MMKAFDDYMTHEAPELPEAPPPKSQRRVASRLAVSESEELMRALDEMTRRLH